MSDEKLEKQQGDGAEEIADKMKNAEDNEIVSDENIDAENEKSVVENQSDSDDLKDADSTSGMSDGEESENDEDEDDGEDWKVPKEELTKIMEGILFVSGRVLTLSTLYKAVPDAKKREVREVIKDLMEKYGNESRGFHLEEINKGFQFRSDPITAPFIREMLKARPTRLSRAALETLAIIAYRQPVTRADVEDIRGVDAGGVMKTLLEKKLVKILGKLEEPGRPMIYGTTKGFLETFNLRSLRDLPTLQEFQELSEEHQAIVDATYSRDEVAKAEEEQDNLFVVPESHADESSTAKELARAAENLEVAVKTIDETVDEIMNRTPYDEIDEDEQLELEPAVNVEIIAGAELMENNEPQSVENEENIDDTENGDGDKQ